MQLLVLTIVYLVQCQGSVIPPEETTGICTRDNTVYVTEQSSTRPTCDDPEALATSRDSQSYCSCKEGYVLDNFKDQNCIPKSACPITPQTCVRDVNSEYKQCESSTRQTCREPDVKAQTMDCRPTCKCNDKYIYDEIAQKCVLPEDCTKSE